MIDDDAFDGFGALTCRECGTSLEVTRRVPRRSWFRRPPARVETTPTVPIRTSAPIP